MDDIAERVNVSLRARDHVHAARHMSDPGVVVLGALMLALGVPMIALAVVAPDSRMLAVPLGAFLCWPTLHYLQNALVRQIAIARDADGWATNYELSITPDHLRAATDWGQLELRWSAIRGWDESDRQLIVYGPPMIAVPHDQAGPSFITAIRQHLVAAGHRPGDFKREQKTERRKLFAVVVGGIVGTAFILWAGVKISS